MTKRDVHKKISQMEKNNIFTPEIERGIPIPKERTRYPGKKITYPWKDMEVGDSFFLSSANTNSVCSAARVYARFNRAKFITRTYDDGVRVWRTE